jgi:heme A synthase
VVEARRQPGWREVVLVALAVVAVVLGAAILTSLLPSAVQQAIFHAPVLIVVLIVGTGWLLWRISRTRPTDDPRAADAPPAGPPPAGPQPAGPRPANDDDPATDDSTADNPS